MVRKPKYLSSLTQMTKILGIVGTPAVLAERNAAVDKQVQHDFQILQTTANNEYRHPHQA